MRQQTGLTPFLALLLAVCVLMGILAPDISFHQPIYDINAETFFQACAEAKRTGNVLVVTQEWVLASGTCDARLEFLPAGKIIIKSGHTVVFKDVFIYREAR